MKSDEAIAIAIGDPNGIGPEIAVKAAASCADSGLRPILVGDTFVIEHYVDLCAPGFRLAGWGDAPGSRCLFHVPVDALPRASFQPGTVSAQAGAATVAYVSRAVSMAREGLAPAVIGCPHSESAVNLAGIEFSGYPGLIADLTNTPREKAFLMLVAGDLRIAHVTLHESVQSALSRLDQRLVVDAARAAFDALARLGLPDASLGVFGVNPHAGEGGLFGDEDIRIVEPAVKELKALGFDVDGPAGADVMLGQRRHGAYLAIFHDQGHIPIKLLSPLRSSALTIGTGIVFSSVGHGSAHDIAGKNIADPTSVLETLRLLSRATGQSSSRSSSRSTSPSADLSTSAGRQAGR